MMENIAGIWFRYDLQERSFLLGAGVFVETEWEGEFTPCIIHEVQARSGKIDNPGGDACACYAAHVDATENKLPGAPKCQRLHWHILFACPLAFKGQCIVNLQAQ
eukprot:1162143-Pelagomonas_calceolata.AAC.20